MVVSDGMGGMNAGDVASEIAVNTVKDFFVSEKITDTVLKSEDSIWKFIKTVIVEADKRIKTEGERDKNKEGMGATIVIAWILNGKAYIGWCGDSRAYLFNPNCGLKQVSKDHSYVQELVDNGLLKPELAFDHPNSNIITRSLGEPNQKANPDFVTVDLCNDDIIMICSDGLCGVLRDNEMEAVIAQNSDDMQKCREALFEAAKNADWTDNTTVTLCKIVSGCPKRPVAKKPLNNNDIKNTKDEFTKSKFEKINKKLGLKNLIIYVLSAILIFILLAGGYWFWKNHKKSSQHTVNPTTLTFVNEKAQTIKILPADTLWAYQKTDNRISLNRENDSTLRVSVLQDSIQQETFFNIISNKKDTLKITVVIEAEKQLPTDKESVHQTPPESPKNIIDNVPKNIEEDLKKNDTGNNITPIPHTPATEIQSAPVQDSTRN